MKAAIKYIAIATLFFAACNNKETETKEATVPHTDTATGVVTVPTLITYQVVNEYPHDITAYTEGLQYIEGFLYESNGQYGKSDLRKIDLATGKILQQQKMDAKYFGEGMTVLNGKIYQLTYKEKKGFVYDQKTMKLLQTFNYPNEEGWGLTNDGAYLIYNDGGSTLFFLDPATLKEVKQVAVTDQYGPVLELNEMEYIKGHIYANQYRTNFIHKIDPATGKVVARADLGTLRQRVGIPEPTYDDAAPEVLNGIAYDAAANRIFITGKNWPKVLEVKLDN